MIIDNNRIEELKKLEYSIDYKFNDINLLNLSLIHTSFTNEHSNLRGKSNQRLEFLGDAVLELVFTEILYKHFKNEDEGKLTKIRASLVSENGFSNLSDIFHLSDYLLLGKGEDKTGGRAKKSIKSDVLEALCGAMYLDSGYDQVYSFIYKNIYETIIEYENTKFDIYDYKTRIQEHLHKTRNTDTKYVLVKEDGPSHEKVFYINLYNGKNLIGEGKGKSKKEAEQMAAKDALMRLGLT